MFKVWVLLCAIQGPCDMDHNLKKSLIVTKPFDNIIDCNKFASMLEKTAKDLLSDEIETLKSQGLTLRNTCSEGEDEGI